jgi:excisionase family DNA binding protein
MDRHELSPSEAARRIGTTTRSVQRWIGAGILPARRVGGRWRVASDALDAFLGSKSDTHAPTAGTARSSVREVLERAGVRTLFVANRGEIAARIRRTGETLGLHVVVPSTTEAAGLDLLDIESVVRAAQSAGADALHPGFGFLAENADFAAAVEVAGVRWVGPPPVAIRAMGDKAAARRLAASLEVPVAAGYDEADQSDAALRDAARRIGPPLLVKPAAGGGGKGIRVVRDLDALDVALGAARREAMAAFGDDRLILERLVEGARHVEVQVLFDGAGHGVHLGERDCSIQRRNQKILEETPSPAVGSDLRARLGDYALRLAGAVGYASAGTCEFLLDDRGSVAFLEMNTRLQVEHPVTELVTGRDLVADQLAIAAGASLAELGVDQAALDAARTAGGHAIEVRLYAEDAEDDFLPATGRIEALQWPTGTGIRVDAGVEVRDLVGGRFDPMLAKIVAHGADRGEALERLAGALDESLVLGLTTNLRFLRWLVRQPVVRDGEARIDTLARIWPPDGWATAAATPEAAWELAAAVLASGAPWSDGWRLNSPAVVRLSSDGDTRAIRLPPGSVDGPNGISSSERPVWVRAGELVHVDVAGRSVSFRLAPPPDVDRAARAAAHHGGGGPVELTAPMPGAVLAIHVDRGAEVEAGDPIVTLEAMKMEHAVVAPIAGTLTDVAVRPADQVARGQLLAIVKP